MDAPDATANAITNTSRFAYAETVDRLVAAIHGAGATVFGRIDQSAAAQGVGLSLRPTTLLIYGNPKAGTLLMDAFPLTALDLPLKFLVWEDGGAVRVAHTPVKTIVERYGASGKDQLVDALEHAVASILTQVT